MRRLLFVLAVLALALAARGQAADTLTILHSFDVSQQRLTAGSNPALVQGADGNFYGVTPGNSDVAGSYGTIFRLAPDGTFTTVHAFNQTDGAHPTSAPIQTGDGSFYGTTSRGGPDNQGTIFRLAPDGTLTTLHAFTFDAVGSSVDAGLARGADGNFYGITVSYGPDSRGVLYRVTPDGVFTVVHVFTMEEGVSPYTTPVQGGDGNFYGTTSLYSNYFGAVYRITPDGALSILHGFSDFNVAGGYPGPLLRGNDGTLYGVTYGGGPDNGAGTVYRLALDGTLTVLHSFSRSPQGYTPDGDEPTTGLIQDRDGNLYGTTSDGYDNDSTSFSGTVFRLAPDGTLTTLHKFIHASIGGGPEAALLLGSDGALYGTTPYSGTSNDGSIFRVTTDSVAPYVPVPVDTSFPSVDGVVNGADNLADTQAGKFQLGLSKPLTSDLKVYYKVTGSGVPGVDYVALKGVAKIKAGKSYKNINLFPIAIPPVDGRQRSVKSVKLTILPGEGYDVYTTTPLKVKITHP